MNYGDDGAPTTVSPADISRLQKLSLSVNQFYSIPCEDGCIVSEECGGYSSVTRRKVNVFCFQQVMLNICHKTFVAQTKVELHIQAYGSPWSVFQLSLTESYIGWTPAD